MTRRGFATAEHRQENERGAPNAFARLDRLVPLRGTPTDAAYCFAPESKRLVRARPDDCLGRGPGALCDDEADHAPAQVARIQSAPILLVVQARRANGRHWALARAETGYVASCLPRLSPFVMSRLSTTLRG